MGAELARGLAGGVSGLAIGGSGEVILNGLEWLGARVYDPTSRGFLSADPLDAVTGAGWSVPEYKAWLYTTLVHQLVQRPRLAPTAYSDLSYSHLMVK